MNPREKIGHHIFRFLLFTLFFLFLIFITLCIITPEYDSSSDPPINGICIGDQIVKLRECINPTCLEGYYVDAGICVEPKQYSFLIIYFMSFRYTAIFSGVFFLCLLFAAISLYEPRQIAAIDNAAIDNAARVSQIAGCERVRVLTERARMSIVELSFFMERNDRESLRVLFYEIKNTFEFVRQCEAYLEIEIPPPYISPPSTSNMLVLAELARDELSCFLETIGRESLRVLFYKMKNTNEFVRGYLERENPPPYISPEQ
jgi:hypothetical protein